jgi:hypothetical protein
MFILCISFMKWKRETDTRRLILIEEKHKDILCNIVLPVYPGKGNEGRLTMSHCTDAQTHIVNSRVDCSPALLVPAPGAAVYGIAGP